MNYMIDLYSSLFRGTEAQRSQRESSYVTNILGFVNKPRSEITKIAKVKSIPGKNQANLTTVYTRHMREAFEFEGLFRTLVKEAFDIIAQKEVMQLTNEELQVLSTYKTATDGDGHRYTCDSIAVISGNFVLTDSIGISWLFIYDRLLPLCRSRLEFMILGSSLMLIDLPDGRAFYDMMLALCKDVHAVSNPSPRFYITIANLMKHTEASEQHILTIDHLQRQYLRLTDKVRMENVVSKISALCPFSPS